MQDETQDAGPETFDETEGPFDADAPEPVVDEPDERVMVDWKGRQFEVACTQYIDNGNTCIVLLDPESGSIEAKATANLSKLPPHRVHIKDYSENRGMAIALVSKGLIQKAGSGLRKGSATFEEYEIQLKLGMRFGIDIPETVTPPTLDESLTQTIEGEEAAYGEDASDAGKSLGGGMGEGTISTASDKPEPPAAE